MEGQSGESDRRKRRRNESKAEDEELESLAASVRQRRELSANLPVGQVSMAFLQAPAQRGGIGISSLLSRTLPGPRVVGGVLAPPSLAGSLLPNTGSLVRTNQLLENQLAQAAFAWPPSSFRNALQFPNPDQRSLTLAGPSSSMRAGSLEGIRNVMLQSRSTLDQATGRPAALPSQLVGQISAQNAMLQSRPLDQISAQSRLAYANVQRRLSQQALLRSILATPTAIRPGESVASLLPPESISPHASAAISSSTAPGSALVTMYIPCDDESLTPYQCLARKQIELFEAGPLEVEDGTQGRNRSVTLGQVGIRCRYCKHLPLRERARASTYYPSKLLGIYQASQNMSNSHLAQFCRQMPKEVRDEMTRLGNKKSAAGGGKDYWASGAKLLGVMEDTHGLRFKKSPRQA